MFNSPRVPHQNRRVGYPRHGLQPDLRGLNPTRIVGWVTRATRGVTHHFKQNLPRLYAIPGLSSTVPLNPMRLNQRQQPLHNLPR